MSIIKTLKDDLSRRSLAKILSSACLGVSSSLPYSYANSSRSQRKKIIRIFLHGGMSHVDSFDPKPQTPELMGNTKVVRTHQGDHFEWLLSSNGKTYG